LSMYEDVSIFKSYLNEFSTRIKIWWKEKNL
jgi:hypothetical protein